MILPPFLRLNYLACKKAGISNNSGLIADYIFQLQGTEDDGWCRANNIVFADLIGVCERQAVRSINDLIEKELLEKTGTSRDRGLRTTDLYSSLFILSMTQSHETEVEPDLSMTQSHETEVEPDLSMTQSHETEVVPDLSMTQSHETSKNQQKFAESYSSLNIESYTSNKILKEEEKNKILQEKSKKKSGEKKSPQGKYPDGFFSKCKTRYEVWREVNGLQPEYFNAKEIGSLRNLLNAISYSIREFDSQGNPLPTNYDDVFVAFDAFFGNMPSRIMQQPISLSMLNMRFNEIVGEQHLSSKLYAPEIEAVIASFRAENKSLHTDYIATDAERKSVIELKRLLTASAKAKNPDAAPTTEQLQKWCSNLFAKINSLEWWGSRVGSISSVVKNYNNIVKAIHDAASPSTPAAVATGKKVVPFYGTELGLKRPATAALFQKNK